MDSTNSLLVPWPEERDFAERLELLDRQIAAWSGAARQASQALVGRAAPTAPSSLARNDDPPAASADRGPVTALPVEPEVEPTTPEPAEDLAVPSLSVPAIQGQRTEVDLGTDAVQERAAASGGTRRVPDPQELADQKLLQSLDQDTLLWIRVRQRISPQPTSVRELLDELAATRRKKRWVPGRR